MDEESGSTQVKYGSPMAVHAAASTVALSHEGCPTEFSNNGSSSQVCMPICFLVKEQAKSQVAIQDLQKRMHNLEGVQDDVISAISEVHEYLSSSGDSSENVLRSPVTSPRSLGSATNAMMNHLNVPRTMPMVVPPPSPMKPRRSSSRTDLASSMSFTDAWKCAQKKTDAVESSITATHSPAHQKFLEGVSESHQKFLRGKDSAPDSDKQDSGLESDCREHGQESNPPHSGALPSSIDRREHGGGGDELMELLDEIGEKSQILRQNISVGGGEEMNFEKSPCVSSETRKAQFERLGLQHMLSSIKGERDVLKSRVEDLETTTEELAFEKKDLEQRFVSTLVEKHKLEARLQGYAVVASGSAGSNKCHETTNDDSSASNDSNAYRLESSDGTSSSKKMGYKVNSADVSAVLKETNAVDLQKQVLTYMMENKVLHTKVEQMEQMLAMKDIEKECLEKVHREEIRQYACEVEQFRMVFEEQKMETTSLRAKVRMLERVLQSVTMENRELNVLLGESMYLKEALQKSRVSVQRPTVSTPAVRYSLPAQNPHEDDVNVRCVKSKHLANSSSFLDVTVEDPYGSDNELAFTIGPLGFSQRKASTPLMQPHRLEKPNFLDIGRPSPVSSDVASRINPNTFRKSGKRLTFSSVKPLVHSTNLSAAELARSRDFRGGAVAANVESCDNNNRLMSSRSDTSAMRNPDNGMHDNDPKKFPFYTILEKLKASSDYKLSTCRTPLREEDKREDCGDVDRAGGGAAAATGGKSVNNGRSSPQADVRFGRSSPDRRCKITANSSPEHGQPKQQDRKSSNPKSLHRRMHNIFDRITAETDDAVI